MTNKSMYTDAQWKWLYDRYKEGYFVAELAEFAKCAKNTMSYHWDRLGLRFQAGHHPQLKRGEFEALGKGRRSMTALEYMEQQAVKHSTNLVRAICNGAPEEQLANIRAKTKYYEDAVAALRKETEHNAKA